jgi:hypothetical protein
VSVVVIIVPNPTDPTPKGSAQGNAIGEFLGAWGLDMHCVVPMEITFIDNGGNIFILCEFIDYMNSHII